MKNICKSWWSLKEAGIKHPIQWQSLKIIYKNYWSLPEAGNKFPI